MTAVVPWRWLMSYLIKISKSTVVICRQPYLHNVAAVNIYCVQFDWHLPTASVFIFLKQILQSLLKRKSWAFFRDVFSTFTCKIVHVWTFSHFVTTNIIAYGRTGYHFYLFVSRVKHLASCFLQERLGAQSILPIRSDWFNNPTMESFIFFLKIFFFTLYWPLPNRNWQRKAVSQGRALAI